MNVNHNNDQYEDLVISRVLNDGLALDYVGYNISPNGVPEFESGSAFPTGAPGEDTTGLLTGDYDNDGFVDLFACDFDDGAKLYRNDGGSGYADVTTASGLATLMGNSDDVYSASWADYDGDGDLDLTVISGVPWNWFGHMKVLRNAGDGTFDAVVLEEYFRVGHTPLWADFDGDHDLDLVILKSEPDPVGAPPGYANYFYVNQGDGTFIEDGWNRLGPVSTIQGGTIAVVADVENDGDLDIVYALHDHGLYYLENAAPGTQGPGYFAATPLGGVSTPGAEPTDLAVLDYDLDGHQDILVGFGFPYASYGACSVHLLGNRDSGGQRVLVDESASAGLSGTAFFVGLSPADYNRDGFTDIYLGRASSEPFFFKAAAAAGTTQNNWLGVRLSSPHGANNTTGLGATVKVTAGAATYTQVVDGGSGFASQHEADLVFGLGGYSGTVTIEAKWPAGRTQTVTGVTTGQYVTVVDDSPVIDGQSITTSKVYDLGTDQVDWIFTWEVHNDSPTSRDRITIDGVSIPGRCVPPDLVLTSQTTGVTITKTPRGGGKYEHTLTYANVPCEGDCDIPYTIESAVVDYASTSKTRIFTVKYCVAR